MIRRLAEVCFIAALFLGVAWVLKTVGFWSKAGLPEPHGYEVQGLVFLAVFFLLATFLFDPYVRLFGEREAQTVGKKEAAEKSRAEAEARIARYRKSIEETRLRAIREREQIALAAEEEERRKLSRARVEGNEAVVQSVMQLSSEATKTREELKAHVAPLANDIVARVLERSEGRSPAATAASADRG